MTAELNANQRFVYRAAGSTDAALLAYAQPVERDELVLAIPDPQRKTASGAIVLPAGKEVALADLLATVKSQFTGQGLGFPQLIMPPPAGDTDALQDVRDYCLVYDFARQARALSIITRIDRIEDIAGISLSPAAPGDISAELRDEFVGEVSAGGYFTADFWEALLAGGADDAELSLIRATADGEDAGLALIVPGTAEFRLLALFTRSEFRAKSVGRLLCGRFIQAAQKASAPLVSASYPAEGACEFYLAKYGFEPMLHWVVQRPPSPDFFAPG
jgi:hypothetical protein